MGNVALQNLALDCALTLAEALLACMAGIIAMRQVGAHAEIKK